MNSRSPHPLQFVLLGFIRQGTHHGYDLYKFISDPEGMGMLWRIKASQVYVILDELVEQDYCTTKVVQDSNRPARKEYTITKQGEAVFTDWISKPVDHPRDIRLTFLARYYFSQHFKNEMGNELIEKQIAACRSWKKGRASLASSMDSSFKDKVNLFREIQIEAILSWLIKLKEDRNS